jgi:hypothetical protein
MHMGCQQAVFKSYTIYKCLQVWARMRSWKLQETERDNPLQCIREKDKVYTIEVFDDKQLKYTVKKEVPTNVVGR